MTAVVLRNAQAADAPALAALARSSFAATYAPSHDAERIRIHCERVLGDDAVLAWCKDPEQHILVAEVDGRMLGFAQWHFAAAPQPARQPLEVKRFYLSADAHGSGLAQRLFDAVRNAAFAAGADLIWLCVYAGNARARRFYEKQGMQPIGWVPYTFVDQVDDDLALGLRLGANPP